MGEFDKRVIVFSEMGLQIIWMVVCLFVCLPLYDWEDERFPPTG